MNYFFTIKEGMNNKLNSKKQIIVAEVRTLTMFSFSGSIEPDRLPDLI